AFTLLASCVRAGRGLHGVLDAPQMLVAGEPSWPTSVRPQPQTLPSLASANVNSSPATILLMPVSVPLPEAATTLTGFVESTLRVLQPSWPYWSSPQVHTEPSAPRATLKSLLAAAARIPDRSPIPSWPTTRLGVGSKSLVKPRPS